MSKIRGVSGQALANSMQHVLPRHIMLNTAETEIWSIANLLPPKSLVCLKYEPLQTLAIYSRVMSEAQATLYENKKESLLVPSEHIMDTTPNT